MLFRSGWKRSDGQRCKKLFFRAGMDVAKIGRPDDAIGGDAGDKLAGGDRRHSAQAAARRDLALHARSRVDRAAEKARGPGQIEIETAGADRLPYRG